MRATLSRYALSIAAAALLAGCGASQLPATISTDGAVPFAFTHFATFRYTGKKQSFKVPRGVTQVRVLAVGASGAGVIIAHGGRVGAVIPVMPSETLAIYVGGAGVSSTGGFNGGGGGGQSGRDFNGYGGGGASDVREGGNALKDRIVVAGGGGGQGADHFKERGRGGLGGALTGGAGKPGLGCCKYYGNGGAGGKGGTQSQGGLGGRGSDRNAGENGSLGVGGIGGSGSSFKYYGYPGGGAGGGGGGYYGGGGGGGGTWTGSYGAGGGGGGGGGSSYAEPSATSVHMWRGWKTASGNGIVILRW